MTWKEEIRKEKPTFRSTRFGLEMDKDGKTYYSYGRNEKGTKSSTIEEFRKELPDHEFIIVPLAIEGREKGTVDFIFGAKR